MEAQKRQRKREDLLELKQGEVGQLGDAAVSSEELSESEPSPEEAKEDDQKDVESDLEIKGD